MIIGVAGGSGSGKTTFCLRLLQKYPKDILLLRCDDYYKPTDGMSEEEKAKINYDCPSAFDIDLLVSHIRLLRSGECVDLPIYDYSVHNRRRETKRVTPMPVIIVEGIIAFSCRELRDIFDLKVFVDANEDARLERRIERDVNTRARTRESVTEQFYNTVKPMHEKYVEPCKVYADIIVRGGGFNEEGLKFVENYINSTLNSIKII